MRKRSILKVLSGVLIICLILQTTVFAEEQPGNEKTPVIGLDQKVEMVASGYSSVLSLLENGEVWGWGRNVCGVLGTGDFNEVKYPVKLFENIEYISMGDFHSAIITKDKELFMWGENSFGQVGAGFESTYELKPVKILDNVKSVSLGSYSSAAVTETGDLYVWGCNQDNRLGISTGSDQPKPVKVLENVKKVCSGSGSMVVLKEDGSILVLGSYNNPLTDTSVKVGNIDIKNVKDVYSGSSTGYAVDNDGTCYLWGYVPFKKEIVQTPQILDTDIKYVNSSSSRVAFIKTNGDLYVRGNNDSGQLGTGDSKYVDSFRKIASGVRTVDTQVDNTYILLENGSLLGCGSSTNCQLANGISWRCNDPIRVMEDVCQANFEHYISVVVKKNGELWGYGSNRNNQIVAGGDKDIIIPRLLATGVRKAVVGEFYVAVLKCNGDLWYCGDFNKASDNITPKLIDSQVEDIKGGRHHIGYIKNKSELWMVGGNTYGQISNPAYSETYSPVLVMNDVKNFDISYFSSYAVDSSGNLYSWGANNIGQLGNGISYGSTDFDIVTGRTLIMENIALVNANGLNASALDTNGNLYVWGYNNDGQLGLGDTLNRSKPVLASNDVKSVSVGLNSIFYIDNNNDLFAAGELSFQNIYRTSNFTKICSDVKEVMAGSAHKGIIKNDDSLWSFGSNLYGEVGAGISGEFNPYPVRIIGQAKVSGYVMPDLDTSVTSSVYNKGGFTVESVTTGTKAVTDENGYFEMNLPNNVIRDALKISKNGYLERTIDNLTIYSNTQISTMENPIKVYTGDFSVSGEQDKAINLTDIISLAFHFNQSEGSILYESVYDINYDKGINMADVMIVAQNFNKCSSEYLSLEGSCLNSEKVESPELLIK